MVKNQEVHVSQVGTTLSIGDLGTKRLSRKRREFLMYFLPMMSLLNGELTHVGENEHAEYMVQEQLKATAATVQQSSFQMQHVRNIMLIASLLGKGLSEKIEHKQEGKAVQFMSVHVSMLIVTL